jgi:hypothetical protein
MGRAVWNGTSGSSDGGKTDRLHVVGDVPFLDVQRQRKPKPKALAGAAGGKETQMRKNGKLLRVAVFVLAASTMSMAEAQTRYSASYCDSYARDRSWSISRGGGLSGAAKGATTGLVVGQIVGGKQKSRKKGAAVGAVVGGTAGAVNRNQLYQSIYEECMRGYLR